jgi:7-carboxy-7-deazaguanine synthase
MTFIRLSGCNAPQAGLSCVRWCDTAESWDTAAGYDRDPLELAAEARLSRVCLTGGEPLLQPEGLVVLGRVLQERSVAVHIETNGTLPLPAGFYPDWLTVSPKPPDYRVHPGLLGFVRELKVIVDESFGDPAERAVEELARTHDGAALVLQPEAGGGDALVHRTAALVMSHPHWRLSLQLHKLLGIR